MIEKFSTKERKKEFNKIFKERIVPLFNQFGFERHTKTSKRLFKNLENKLSVFIFIEYKSLFGFYDITIAYFDEEIGDVYNDQYLVMVNKLKPSFDGENKEELNLSLDKWIIEMTSNVFPFIEEHSTHKSILQSNKFYISKAREKEISELLKRKSE